MTATILRPAAPPKAPHDHGTDHVKAAKPTPEEIADWCHPRRRQSTSAHTHGLG
jgi:hypothetical protein